MKRPLFLIRSEAHFDPTEETRQVPQTRVPGETPFEGHLMEIDDYDPRIIRKAGNEKVSSVKVVVKSAASVKERKGLPNAAGQHATGNAAGLLRPKRVMTRLRLPSRLPRSSAQRIGSGTGTPAPKRASSRRHSRSAREPRKKAANRSANFGERNSLTHSLANGDSTTQTFRARPSFRINSGESDSTAFRISFRKEASPVRTAPRQAPLWKGSARFTV